MALEINPFQLPDDQKGWRGIEVHGRPRRRVYTVLETDQVLVTALLQIPGEPGVRHSHETGELSFRWGGDMTPFITWHPPGEWHGGAAEVRASKASEVADGVALLRSQLQSGRGGGRVAAPHRRDAPGADRRAAAPGAQRQGPRGRPRSADRPPLPAVQDDDRRRLLPRGAHYHRPVVRLSDPREWP